MDPQPSTGPVARADDRRLRSVGYGVVLAVFGGLGTWAALAPLSSAAHAPGVIAVESYRKTVQHLEGGIVKAIHVRDGDPVQPGQLLVVLDDTQARSQLEVLRGQTFISLAREARLVAQRDALSAIHYPAELMRQRADERVREAMALQEQTFRARRQAQEGEAGLYERQIQQLRSKIDGLRSQQKSQEHLAGSFKSELADFETLLNDGYAEKQKVRELARNLAQSEGQRGQLIAEIAAAELQISETRLKIMQLRRELAREVAKELADVQNDLFGLREKAQSLQATVDRSVVRAPDAGTVLGLTVHTLGAVVSPGGRLLDIVPQKERLLVEAQVAPTDIDKVRTGQTAEVRFPAFKMRDTPRIEGRLVGVSADRVFDEKDKTPFYLARVEVTAQGLEDLARQQLQLVPGMPAEVLINTGSRTLLQYMVDPFKNVLARSLKEH
jgi:epimerase transport system membrane fusion protein